MLECWSANITTQKTKEPNNGRSNKQECKGLGRKTNQGGAGWFFVCWFVEMLPKISHLDPPSKEFAKRRAQVFLARQP
jgi:hypothetical protein